MGNAKYLSLLCDEINVKNIEIHVCHTEKGAVVINYNKERSEYTWLLDGEDVTTDKLLETTDHWVNKLLCK